MSELTAQQLILVRDEIDQFMIGLDEMCGIGGTAFPAQSAVRMFESCLDSVLLGYRPDEFFTRLIVRITSIIYPNESTLSSTQELTVLDIIRGIWTLYLSAQEVSNN